MKKIITLLVLMLCLNANAQIITTVVGSGTQGYSGDGGQAITAEINNPYSIIFDAFGNLLIVDTYNNCIRKVNSLGVINTIVGNGTAGFSGDGGQASAAELNTPWGITFDVSGNLYIADYGNFRIRKVNTFGIISTVAGNGVFGFSGDGGQATAAELSAPPGVTLDAMGNIYIPDFQNNRIRKINTSGIIITIAGNGILGFSGDGGQASAAELNYPYGVVFDAVGNLYVEDRDNNRIRMINTTGIITTIAGNGTQGYSGDGGQATVAELYHPTGIVIDATGNLYFADDANQCIRKINSLGVISTIAGNGTAGFSGDGGQATSAELWAPVIIALDGLGNLYITDEGNSRIRKVTNVAAAGIGQFVNSNYHINVYPNPTSTNFTIETTYTNKQTLQLFDVNGKLVLSQTINGKATIDATNLGEGVYNLSLINSTGVANKRLVIIR